MRTIFASLARTNERVHRHNETNFPQAKLDSKINVPFLLNEHGDLYFLSHNNGVYIILFNLKNKGKQDESMPKKQYSGTQIMTAKTMTMRTLNVRVVINGVIFRQILYDIVPYARHFLPVKFFPEYYFNKLCFQLLQNITWTDQ